MTVRLRTDKVGMCEKEKRLEGEAPAFVRQFSIVEYILRTYKESTVSPKPRYREEKKSLYIFDYNQNTEFCKRFFSEFVGFFGCFSLNRQLQEQRYIHTQVVRNRYF